MCVFEDMNMLNVALCISHRGNISSRLSSKSESSASELRENLKEMFPRYLHLSIDHGYCM